MVIKDNEGMLRTFEHGQWNLRIQRNEKKNGYNVYHFHTLQYDVRLVTLMQKRKSMSLLELFLGTELSSVVQA